MNNGRVLAMRLRNASTHLPNKIYYCRNWNKATAIGTPKFIEAPASDVFHCKVAALALRCFKNVSIKHAHDVRVAYSRQEYRLTKHFLNLIEIHTDALKDLQCLPAQKAMFNSVNLGERSFT